MKPKPHGGKRKGAGRPKGPETVNIRVLATTAARLSAIAASTGKTVAETAAKLVGE